MLGVPYLALDSIFWAPGWGQLSSAEFKTQLRGFIAQNDTGWVIDGNYDSQIGDILTKETTDIVCGCTFSSSIFFYADAPHQG